MVVGAPIPIAVVGRTIGELSNEIVFTRGDGNLAFTDGVAGEFTREFVAVGISEVGILILADAFHHPASVDSAVMVSGYTLTIGLSVLPLTLPNEVGVRARSSFNM